jgi:SOS response regulatory protein OraA/RecX
MFVESYTRSEIISKGKPVIRVLQKLREKWVEQELVQEVLNKQQNEMSEGIHSKIKKEIAAYKKKDVDWFEIIQKLMRKWYKYQDIKEVIESK